MITVLAAVALMLTAERAAATSGILSASPGYPGQNRICAVVADVFNCWAYSPQGALEERASPLDYSMQFLYDYSDRPFKPWDPLLEPPLKFSVGPLAGCFLDKLGLKCKSSGSAFSGTPADISEVPDLTNPREVHVNQSIYEYACALDDNGLVCWGGEFVPSPMPTLQNPASFAVGPTDVCVVDSGEVICWGEITADGGYDVPDLVNPSQVSMSASHACAIDDSGVVCWDSNKVKQQCYSNQEMYFGFRCFGQNYEANAALQGISVEDLVPESQVYGHLNPPLLSNPTYVSTGYFNTCAIDDTGLICWGRSVNNGDIELTKLSNPSSVATGLQFGGGPSYACALDDNGISCWGFGKGALEIPSFKDTDLDRIADFTDWDSDGDGVINPADAQPLNATETLDNDSDGIGNNADNDDDNDGYTDTEELDEGTDPLNTNSTPIRGLSLTLIKAFLDKQNGNSQANNPAEANLSNSNNVPFIVGDWKLSPEAGAFGVGPALGDTSWYASGEADIAGRACLFDDIYRFGADGTFSNVMGDESWIEAWQGAATEACGALVAPHDGSNSATYVYDKAGSTITVNGLGAHIGLAKVFNGGELASPADAKESITYTITAQTNITQTNITMTLDIAIQGGTYWRFKLIKIE